MTREKQLQKTADDKPVAVCTNGVFTGTYEDEQVLSPSKAFRLLNSR